MLLFNKKAKNLWQVKNQNITAATEFKTLYGEYQYCEYKGKYFFLKSDSSYWGKVYICLGNNIYQWMLRIIWVSPLQKLTFPKSPFKFKISVSIWDFATFFSCLTWVEDTTTFIVLCFVVRIFMALGTVAINTSLFVIVMMVWSDQVAYTLVNILVIVLTQIPLGNNLLNSLCHYFSHSML